MANTANLSIAEIEALIPTPESTLTTDFSVSPYYDDFDPKDDYYKIVWKPGYAIQSRELTSLQSMVQKQIDRFGKHVFREGSIVLPGEFNIETDVDYIKIKDTNSINVAVSVSEFKDKTLVSSTGVSAYVIDVADGSEDIENTKTLYVRYQSSGTSNTQIKTFQSGETLSTGDNTVVVLNDNPIGKGSRFVIREGVFFAKEHFISFPTQSVILNRYSSTPTCRVGFQVLETIITFNDDLRLLDPALESSNYAAPGADRLKLTPILTVKPYEDTEGAPDFVELFRIKDGAITELFERSQYNILGDELAKRTLDESGDYYLRGLNVRVRENLDVNDNGGLSATGNTSLLSIGVEPGLGYVKGYPVELFVTKYVEVPKSISFENVSTQISSATMGNYIKVKEFTGSVSQDTGSVILLKDQPMHRLSNNKWASTSATGNTIGTAKVRTIEYESGMLGTPNAEVLVYVSDIRMNGSNSFAQTKSIVATNFGGDPVLESNVAVLKESSADTLIYRVGVEGVRTLRDNSGNPKMSFNFKRTSTGISISSGELVIPISIPDESFPYGTTTLSSADKREILLSVNSDISLTGPSTVTVSGGTTVTGASAATLFTRLNVGDKIQFTGNTKPYFIASITSDSSLTVTETLPSLGSGVAWAKVYKNGDIIDLNSKGFSTGAERSVSATPESLSINLGESITDTATISYQVNRSNAKEISKILRANAHVKINVANTSIGTSGPYPLGFADVFKLNSVTVIGSGADVTSNFILDTGQRDAFYDHATIVPKSPLANNTQLLVSFDFFEPSFTVGKGYFSVDSYPVNDTISFDPTVNIRTETIPIYRSDITGTEYDLRNSIDFRPVKSNTAPYVTSTSGAAANPTTDAPFRVDTNGLRIPVPSTQFSFDYSFYLPRRDLVVIDKNKEVKVIQGIPSINPRLPSTPENVMALASVYVTPYPSLAISYAQKLNRKDLGCAVRKMSNIRFTMRDIGVLKSRIENLEYYGSLNTLQKSALDMNILDENNLNRFKNGVFVDTFTDHTFGDTRNPDYRIIVDKREKSIRPLYTADSIDYEYLDGESSGVQKTGDLITLPYTEELLLEQPQVTSFRNIELSSYRFVGTLELQPAIDTWVDTITIPDEQIKIGDDENNLPQSFTTYEVETDINGYIVGAPNKGNTGKLSKNYGSGGTGTAVPTDYKGTTTLISARNSPGDQSVTQLSTTTTTTTKTEYTYEEETISLGSRVVDVSIIPYIRPQTIDVWARGLKANTRVYVFFDGEDMTNYCAPLNVTQYNQTPEQRRLSGFIPNEAANIVSNANGNAYFALRLPATGKQFRVGQKEIVVTDSPTNSIDATTSAKNYFVASGLTQQLSGTVLTTGTIKSSVDVDVKEKNTSQLIGYLDNPSCSAYSIYVKAPLEDEGTFMTGVDLFFARKHPTLGVWVEIRAMDSAGGITRTQVPYSEVWVEADDIVISEDGYTNPTRINFPGLVFLRNNTQYAFVIHTVGLNPDTYLWIARLGETDVRPDSLGGGKKYSARPLTGTFYTTNNNLNWNMVDDIDLKINFYRAKFNTNVTGQAILGNEPVEKMLVTDASTSFDRHGEPFTGNYRLSLTGNVSSIIVSDYLVGQNSGANGVVTSVSGGVASVANNKFISGETVTIIRANTSPSGFTSLISSIGYGSAKLEKFHVYRGNTTVNFAESNGGFRVGDTLQGGYTFETATVSSILNQRYSKVTFEPTYLSFNRTGIGFEMRPTSNTGTLGSYRPVSEGGAYLFDTEQALFSRSNELEFLSGERSNKTRITMTSQTDYLSPVFDISKTRSVYVDNIINANTVYDLELFPAGGELINKYISRVVTLADGQDAEDLHVYLTSYRPPGTDVLVWCKLLNAEDTDTMAQRGWIPMNKSSEGAFSSISNRADFREYRYTIPESYLTGPQTDNSPGGEVQYTNSKGAVFTGYKYFAIKVGLAGNNSAIVPRVADLRAICLQL